MIDKVGKDERGSAHILLLGLLGVAFSVLLFVVSLHWMLLSANKTKTKLALDRATHAASLHIDAEQAAYGRLVWDQSSGEAAFFKYLDMNLQLDAAGEPLSGSHLEAAPVVHLLEFVEFPVYPRVLRRSIVVDDGEGEPIVRNIEVTVYGPSVVAVLEAHQRIPGRLEPIVLSSVASIRFR